MDEEGMRDSQIVVKDLEVNYEANLTIPSSGHNQHTKLQPAKAYLRLNQHIVQLLSITSYHTAERHYTIPLTHLTRLSSAESKTP
ncbi:hypothetical protein ACSQ67_010407 [Phaseolus vulgaris]